jgi:hypothetical protein
MTTAQKLLYHSRVHKIQMMEERRERLATGIAALERKIAKLKELNASTLGKEKGA